jgi:antitoxin component YwqK of YwqJK toxin-antitoxin module
MDQRDKKEFTVGYDDIEYHEDMYVYHGDKRFTGHVVDKDEDGHVLTDISYVAGFKDGPELEYYPNGKLKSERIYQIALVHGRARTWYEDGSLESETIYDEGRPVSKKKWTAEGEPIDMG